MLKKYRINHPDSSDNPIRCQNLSYNRNLGVCYSAGNKLAIDSYDPPNVNLCVNPWFVRLNDIEDREQLDKICDRIPNHRLSPILNPNPKRIDPCILDPKYRFFLIKLISNRLNQARTQDLDLVNPWGLVSIDNILWIVDNLAGLITTYDSLGNKLAITIGVVDRADFVPRPSAMIENQTNGFIITNGIDSLPSFLIVSTQNGVISGYNSIINPIRTVQLVDRSAFGSVYTGLTIANDNLYAVDFFNNRIDVFDSTMNRMDGFDFIDEDRNNPLPRSYAAFNIELINNSLYVTYALQNPSDRSVPLAGQGNGYVGVFTLGGVFVRRLITRGYLNGPWGMCLAPKSAGFPPHTIFIGNNGDGIINVYDTNGIHLGKLTDMNGCIIQLAGLWSLVQHNSNSNFNSNSNSNSNSRSIIFTSGPSSQTDGLVGSLSK